MRARATEGSPASYIVADFLSTNLAVFLFNVFRYYELPVAYQSFLSLGEFLVAPMLIAGQILFPLTMMLIYYMQGNYSRVYMRSRAGELLSTLYSALVGTLILVFVALINDLTLDRTRDYALFVVLFLFLFLIVYLPRLWLTCRNHKRLKTGDVFFPTLIVGHGSHPELFEAQARKMLPVLGMRPVGLVDYQNQSDRLAGLCGLPSFNFDDLEKVIARKHIRQLVVIPHPDGLDATASMISPLYGVGLPVYVAADNLPAYLFRKQILNLKAEPYIDVTGGRLNASTMCCKRVAGLFLSALTLAVMAVPMAVMAVAIKLDSSGPVFYRQKRVGRNGKEFNIIKLRTMREDSESDGRPALSHHGDRRVTRVGRILRKYRLDEFPQFFNVLRGDMSIVGPRPERDYFVKEIAAREPAYPLIHRLRPGITSLGMVKYGYASSIDEMVIRSQYDLLYLENVSIATDLKIILYTARTVITGKGV